MHIADHADNASGCCLLTGTSEDPNGFLNLETPADPRRARGNQVISVSYLREIIPEVGGVTPADVQALYAEIADLKLQLALSEAETEAARGEADALYTLAGPKLWAKAQHIRKNASFYGRRKIDLIQQFSKGEIDEDEFDAKMDEFDAKAAA